MKILLVLAFLFVVGSLMGWVIELFFRRFVTSKKWINPGFLTGPYLPIYGFGIDVLYLMSSIKLNYINNPIIRNIVLILIMTLGMVIIEYIAGIIFIKGMKVKLWDYSDRWGNIDGIICPLFTFFWGIACAIYYFCIHPYIINAVSWFTNNLAFSFIIGFVFGIMTIDACHSMNIVVKLKRFAKENNILIKYEAIKEHIRDLQLQSKEKINYLLAFKTNYDWKDLLEEYKEKYNEDENKFKKWKINLFVRSFNKVKDNNKKIKTKSKKIKKSENLNIINKSKKNKINKVSKEKNNK